MAFTHFPRSTRLLGATVLALGVTQAIAAGAVGQRHGPDALSAGHGAVQQRAVEPGGRDLPARGR